MLEHILGRVGTVLERDVLKAHRAVGHRLERIFRRGEVNLFVQHLRDAVYARERAREQQKHVGNHDERVQDLKHVRQKARELAHGQGPAQDHLPAKPHDESRRRVHGNVEHGHVEDRKTKRPLARSGKSLVDAPKLLALIVAAHIGLDRADRREHLLHHIVQLVDRDLQHAVQRAHAADDHHDGDRHDRHHGAKHQCELRVEVKRERKADDEHHRPSHHGAKACVEGVLDHGYVGGHTRDER